MSSHEREIHDQPSYFINPHGVYFIISGEIRVNREKIGSGQFYHSEEELRAAASEVNGPIHESTPDDLSWYHPLNIVIKRDSEGKSTNIVSIVNDAFLFTMPTEELEAFIADLVF